MASEQCAWGPGAGYHHKRRIIVSGEGVHEPGSETGISETSRRTVGR